MEQPFFFCLLFKTIRAHIYTTPAVLRQGEILGAGIGISGACSIIISNGTACTVHGTFDRSEFRS